MDEKQKNRLAKFVVQFKKVREKKGISQRELANRCDIGHAKINRIENNKSNITITTLIELAEGLGVHPKELLDTTFD